MVRHLLMGAACAALWCSSASADPVTVETLLALEELGRVQTDPTSRWIVAERRMPQSRWPSYDYGYEGTVRYGDLYAGELRSGSALEPLLAPEAGVGYSVGPFSPDGRLLVVYRLTGRDWRLGVIDMESRAVQWTAIAPLIPIWGRALEWVSNTHLAVLGTPDGQRPGRLIQPRRSQDLLPGLWSRSAAGEASFVVNEAGPVHSVDPPLPDAVLWSLDTPSGRVSAMARGPFLDMETSPDGRTIAITLDNVPDREPISGPVAEIRRRRGLLLVDVRSGQATRPTSAADISPALLAWSPDSSDLLVFSRAIDAFLTVSATGEARALDLGPLTPWRPLLEGADLQPQGAWVGDAPAVRAHLAGSDRADWWRISRGSPENLSEGLSAPGPILAQFEEGIAVTDGDRVTVLETTGATDVGPGARRAPAERTPRSFTDAMKRDSAAVAVEGGFCQITGARQRRCVGGISAHPLVVDGVTDTLVSREPSPGGGDVLAVTIAGRRFEVLTINPALASVQYPAPIRVEAGGASGWLYLPSGAGPFPVVMIPYPERTYPGPPSEMEPGARSAVRSGAPLVTAGYAVLYPDVPGVLDPGHELANRLLAVVDAAADQNPAVDRDRIGLFGWSFGAWASVLATTQTDRFDAAVALNGPYDPLSVLGSTSSEGRTLGRMQSWATDNARWLETGQARMQTQYWLDPTPYQRNSAVIHADKITAPILLLSGDQDAGVSQAELMFGALNRLDREVVLITFFGEGHGLFSPGNLRQMYIQTIGWFDRHLKGDAAATPGAIASVGTRPLSERD